MTVKLTRAELQLCAALLDKCFKPASVVFKLYAHVRAQDEALREIAAYGTNVEDRGLALYQINKIARAARMEE